MASPMRPIAFEDFIPGSVAVSSPTHVTQDDIVAFAREYDPQPMHVDPDAAQASFAGTLIASGWHTCALLMRMIADDFLLASASMGSPGIEEVKWLKGVRPGCTLSMRRAVLETRPSKSRPEMGLVRFRFDLLDETGDTVMTQVNPIMFGRREAAQSAGKAPPAPDPAKAAPAPVEPDAVRPSRYFDDLPVGETSVLGAFTFTADDIKRFAEAYDPQPFHVCEEAARQSHFGALCASGWHTTAVWMKLLIARRSLADAASRARGETPAQLGASPGFRDLKWSKPVYAGDTITYRTEFAGKRLSASRPGWGLVFHRNTGHNQDGDQVLAFTGAVFWQRRPDWARCAGAGHAP